MRVALMQPYFFPYIGYFELIKNVDLFIFYDDAAFSKNGWYNRNRILSPAKDFEYIRASIKKASLGTSVRDIMLSDPQGDRDRSLSVLNIYNASRNYKEVKSIVSETYLSAGNSLSEIAVLSVINSCKFLEIGTSFDFSSQINYNRNATAADKVLQICAAVGATHYVNLSGGKHLYDHQLFIKHGIQLLFTEESNFVYGYDGLPSVPNLSIVDVMMRCDPSNVASYLDSKGSH
jgi:hypothetical protein